MCRKQNLLRQPEPELLKDVARDLLWPVRISHVQGCLAGEDVRLGGLDPPRTLKDLPERVEQEVDHDTDIGSGKVIDGEWREYVEAVEEDDDGEEDQRDPREVWLEMALEDQGVAVDALSLECTVELEICNADAAPREETGNRRQVLEPLERLGGTPRPTAQIGEERDRGGDRNSKVWYTTGNGLAQCTHVKRRSETYVLEHLSKKRGACPFWARAYRYRLPV